PRATRLGAHQSFLSRLRPEDLEPFNQQLQATRWEGAILRGQTRQQTNCMGVVVSYKYDQGPSACAWRRRTAHSAIPHRCLQRRAPVSRSSTFSASSNRRNPKSISHPAATALSAADVAHAVVPLLTPTAGRP